MDGNKYLKDHLVVHSILDVLKLVVKVNEIDSKETENVMEANRKISRERRSPPR